MLIELCVGNYATHDDLFNGANEVFQYVSKLHDSESLIRTAFNNPKVGSTTSIQSQHLYPTNIPQHWTPIQPISKEIQASANSNHVITCTQYQIQLVVALTIHHSQGLTLDYLAFDPNGVHHHSLTCTTLSSVRFFFLLPLLDVNFKVDKFVLDKMQWLRTIQ
jgi:hypothetical protein